MAQSGQTKPKAETLKSRLLPAWRSWHVKGFAVNLEPSTS
jgi:hypothetical protein